MAFFGSSWSENWYADNEKKREHYFMYGLRIPYKRYFEWEKTEGRKLPVGTYGDIFCSYRGRDGAWLIVGRKIRASNNESPILVPELTDEEENEIRASVKEKFKFDGEYHYYYVID